MKGRLEMQHFSSVVIDNYNVYNNLWLKYSVDILSDIL